MGLSGRKAKQRIPNDPRNLSWADDAARFGSNYLAKFGWNSSQGLGVQGDGRTSHIKVSHKLDMLGIGAAQQRDPNGIAWKQNKDFENLLRRLNEQGTATTAPAEEEDEKLSVKAEEVDGEEEEKARKKREKKERKEKKKKAKDSEENSSPEDPKKEEQATVIEEKVVAVKSTTTTTTRVIPRHRSHRAKHMAAKNLASKSSAHISEILGIAPTPSTSSPSTSGLTSGADTPLEECTPEDQVGLEKITTSTKSVADYFKEKLQIKGSSSSSSSSPSPNTASSAFGSSRDRYDDDMDERPRMGLGSSRLSTVMFSRTEVDEAEETTMVRGGIGTSKFSSMFSSSFMAASSSTTMKVEEVSADVKPKEEKAEDVMAVDTPKKKRKRKHRDEQENDPEESMVKVEAVEDTESKESRKKKRKKERGVEADGEEPSERKSRKSESSGNVEGIEEPKESRKKRKSKSGEDSESLETVDPLPEASDKKKAKKDKKKKRQKDEDSDA